MVNIWVSKDIRKRINILAGMKKSITGEECSAGEIVEFLIKVYEDKILEMSKDEMADFLGGL